MVNGTGDDHVDPEWRKGEGWYMSKQPCTPHVIFYFLDIHKPNQPTTSAQTQPVIYMEPAHTDSNRNISTNQPEGKTKQKLLTVHLWE